jgi:hypothetical protein
VVVVAVVVVVVEKSLTITHAVLLKVIDVQIVVVSSCTSTQATIVIWLCGPALRNSRSLGVRYVLVVG